MKAWYIRNIYSKQRVLLVFSFGSANNEKAAVIDDGIFYGANVDKIFNKEQWDEKISEAKKDGKMVIANFSSAWCDPCQVIAPFFAELSAKYPSFIFLAIDVDQLSEFSASWDIQATPTFFFLEDGQKLDKLVGSENMELEKKLIEFVNGSINHERSLESDLH
nr:PREDICTED: thioredoxin H4-1-like isoform X1 [Musa acuminata subsp. malaccensis]XP_018684567.1 PREDICTED: thioredoxin H4-1-like isoform X1 [Musa acuminata subsp. malaccensis]